MAKPATAQLISEQPRVQLNISLEQAITLRALLACTDGHNQRSYRKHAQEIGNALGEANVPWDYENRVRCGSVVMQPITGAQDE